MCELSKNAVEIAENDQLRSDFISCILQKEYLPSTFITHLSKTIPKTIVQFWDDSDNIPPDVLECIETWSFLDEQGYTRLLFNEYSARSFISESFTQSHVEAFDRCYHPAMKSDYFRLCFILSRGGCYIDADDAYNGSNIELFFTDDKLKLQPLCYDISTDTMIEPNVFMNPLNHSSDWIFYFNNNPIIASPSNPIIKYALERATKILLEIDQNDFPEIQSTTGPGNLTASLVANIASYELKNNPFAFLILENWNAHARTIWPLSYRQDSRNWRLSNKKIFYVR